MPSSEQIRDLLAREPEDTFLNFGLAMALWSERDTNAALAQFERTLRIDGDYVPAHFQRGRLLAELGRDDDAIAVLNAGIEAAIRTGDTHAKGEMEEFLAGLEI